MGRGRGRRHSPSPWTREGFRDNLSCMPSLSTQADPSDGTHGLSNLKIAVYALYQVGGTSVRQDTEDVAQECFTLAAHRFSWKKYPYPNLDTVKQALADARRPRNGRLVSGGEREGWILTPDGADVAQCIAAQARVSLARGTETLRPEERRLLAIVDESWRRSGHMIPDGAASLVAVAVASGLLPDAPRSAVVRRLDHLRSIARSAKRADLEGYVEWLLHSANADA